ncbi:hypothetical protein [Roseimicrobium sp. ORNL1]|uniref:hypothetical protein n=1 Tax=Roseimicrobium sp. ORNL1 TaxID=2711231 RepID=UPI0013E13B2D|nr:hypothetical protein [Roseimicrobium sp. ORNL1]QIF01706.1 hypothetical protein G5S37_09275 [Roseimicrobium sp. ORNL1]
MTALTHYYSPVPVQHPLAGKLAEICSFLPTPFTLQDVVEAAEIHAPECIYDLPGAWECLRSTEQIETVGLCGSVFRLTSRT